MLNGRPIVFSSKVLMKESGQQADVIGGWKVTCALISLTSPLHKSLPTSSEQGLVFLECRGRKKTQQAAEVAFVCLVKGLQRLLNILLKRCTLWAPALLSHFIKTLNCWRRSRRESGQPALLTPALALTSTPHLMVWPVSKVSFPFHGKEEGAV